MLSANPRLFNRRYRRAAAAVALAAAAGACSAVPLAPGTQPAATPNYGPLISQAVKGYKDFGAYSNFEISGLRWVHAQVGWSWLACLRYRDRGRRYTYVFFIKDDKIVDARYDILADQCGRQQYVPYDPATGVFTPAYSGLQEPIY